MIDKKYSPYNSNENHLRDGIPGNKNILSEQFVDVPKLAEVQKKADSLKLEYTETAMETPEFYANPPLENTSLVYSVPVMGEWHNGNLKRMLLAFLSQHTNAGEAFEIELITNIGGHIEELKARKDNDQENISESDEKGNCILNTRKMRDDQRQAFEILRETDKSSSFIKRIIEAQKLARELKKHSPNQGIVTLLQKIIEVDDPAEANILRLAAEKADTVSLAMIDATRVVLDNTPYRFVNTRSEKIAHIGSIRTLGADVAAVRFADNQDVVLHLFDADTVPEGNKAIACLQKIFREHQDLNYIFPSMTYLPAGTSKKLFSDSPHYSVKKTKAYNDDWEHGSPQLCFRLKVYCRLKEISGKRGEDFSGYEDYDTGIKIIYQYGNAQQGLLFEKYGELVPPSVRTSDRTDGFFDAADRNRNFASMAVKHVADDLGSVYSRRLRLEDQINHESQEKQKEIRCSLDFFRQFYLKKECVQQRFNRKILRAFLHAVENGFVRIEDGNTNIDIEKILELPGGKALALYLEYNRTFVTEILSSTDNIEFIKFILGKTKELPPHIQSLSDVQMAIREYVGDIKTFDALLKEDMNGIIAESKNPKTTHSLMHGIIVEILAFCRVYDTFFKIDDFKQTRYNQQLWPQNSDEQNLSSSCQNPEEREKWLLKFMPLLKVREALA